jgi:hypothetical protein
MGQRTRPADLRTKLSQLRKRTASGASTPITAVRLRVRDSVARSPSELRPLQSRRADGQAPALSAREARRKR